MPFITSMILSIVALCQTSLYASGSVIKQVAPLPIQSETECTTADPKYALAQKQLLSSTKYSRHVEKILPVNTIEKVIFANGDSITIRQSGCADLQATIVVEVSKTCKNVVKCSVDALNSLVFDPEGFFLDKNIIMKITSNLSMQLKTNRKESLVCLQHIDSKKSNSECVTDLKMTIAKSSLTINYIDRP